MPSEDEALESIRAIARGNEERAERAKLFAETVRSLGNYRWTGVYDVGSELVSIVAFSSLAHGTGTSRGPGAPAYPSFPIGNGLTGAAIREKATVVVGDVRTDPRYLTAFGNTLSEIIVPIVDPGSGAVIGTIDAESEHADAFSAHDQEFLEKCARAALPLWIA